MFDLVAAASAAAGLATFSLVWFALLLAWHGLHARGDRRHARLRGLAEALLQTVEAGEAPLDDTIRAVRRRPAVLAEALAVHRFERGAAERLALAVEEAGLSSLLRQRAEQARGMIQLTFIDALGALPGHETERVLRRIWFLRRGEARLAALQALEELGRPLPLGAVLRSLDDDQIAASGRLAPLLEVLVRGRPDAAAKMARSGKLTPRTHKAFQLAIARAGRPGAAADRPSAPAPVPA